MAFDKSKYDVEYRKKHKVQFNVDLNKDEMVELEKLLAKHKLSKVQFVRWSIDKLKQEKAEN